MMTVVIGRCYGHCRLSPRRHDTAETQMAGIMSRSFCHGEEWYVGYVDDINVDEQIMLMIVKWFGEY